MPTIAVKKRLFDKHLGESLSRKDVSDLCLLYGLELETKVEKDEETGVEEEVYKVELPANRQDLLSVEGLTRALLIFQKKQSTPHYGIAPVKRMRKIVVEQETATVRPYVVAAILRNVHLDKDSYASFIDLQDKLHQNIGRRRTIVSMGTHDLDKIAPGELRYRALPPKKIVFKPLNQSREFNAEELMEVYSNSHLREYLTIIRDKEVYPVFYDAKNVVLSMPPIINGDHTKITLNTKNIFIEMTGTDLKKLEIVLDTLVALFSQYCATPYSVEPVEIVHPDGQSRTYPILNYREMLINRASISKKIGVDFTSKQITELLSKMGIECQPIGDDGAQLKAIIPPTRHDILHECDIAEDVAVSYDINNIVPRHEQSHTVAQPLPINKLADQLRHEMVAAGWTEVLNFALCSTEDISTKLRKDKSELADVVKISNPKTTDFQVVRRRLLPGILKTLSSSKGKLPLPLKLFEIQDVVFIDVTQDTKCRNERHLAAIFCSNSGGFEIIHGLLDRVMVTLDARHDEEPRYSISETEDSIFFEGRCGKINYNGQQIGMFGVVHPEVLANFSLNQPCSYFEMSIEPFL